MASHHRILRLLAGVTALAATCGCANPEGEFDNFVDRYDVINPGTSSSSTGGNCTLPMPGEADGDYFFALSAAISPKKPLVFAATVTTTAGTDGLDVSMSLQPLDASDRMTEVESPIVYNFAVGNDGAFTSDANDISVGGVANPVNDNPLSATMVVFIGSFCAPTDFVCGAVTGDLVTPLATPLTNSTFTMTKVTSPADYPEPPPINCAGDLADDPKGSM